MLTREDLTTAREAYDDAIAQADRQRAAIVAQAIAEGMPQKDVIDAMGYSRETVRRIAQAGKEAAATYAAIQAQSIDLSGDVVKLASVESFSPDQIKNLASGGSVTIPFTGIFDNGTTDEPKGAE